VKKKLIVIISISMLLLIVISNYITARLISQIVRENTISSLTFRSNNIIVDNGRYIIIDNEAGGYSFYENRGPFNMTTAFLEDIDIVPTVESAVRIADIISSAMNNERYGEFNPFEHDAEVRFFEYDNVWEVFYHPKKFNKRDILNEALGSRGTLGWKNAGPSFIINKTTGEIKILHEGFS